MTQQQLMLRKLNEAIATKATTPPPSYHGNRIRELIDRVHNGGGLEIEGFAPQKDPAVKNLGQVSRDFDHEMHQQRGMKTSFGHTVWRTGKGEDDYTPVRIWFDYKP